MRAHLCQEIIASRKNHEHTTMMVLLKEWLYFIFLSGLFTRPSVS